MTGEAGPSAPGLRPAGQAGALPRPAISGRWLLLGVLPVVGYAFTTGVLNAYAGRLFQAYDPASVAAISFSLTAAAFAALELGPHLRALACLSDAGFPPRSVMSLRFLLSAGSTLGIMVLVALGVLARRRSAARARAARVAIVDAYSTGRHLAAALRQHGAECVHVQSPAPDIHLAFDPDGFVECLRHGGNLGATAAALRNLGVGLVVAGAESGVLLADQLSAALGTPGNGMRRLHARRNKYEMVTALRDAGVAHAAISSGSRDTIVAAWAETKAQWPVMLKPVSSAGTDNVICCSSAEQVRAAFEAIVGSSDRYGRLNTEVLAQEFLEGDEYFVNTVSRDGRHCTAELWRYYKRRIPGGHIIFDYHEPVDPSDPDGSRVERYTRQVLDALEIRNGAGHSEVMLTRRGPVLVECGARLGGGQVPDINVRCLGVSQLHLLALALADLEAFKQLPDVAYTIRERPRHVSLINPRPLGVVPTDETLAEIRALPSYARAVMAHPAGHQIPRTVDVVTSPGFVYLISDDPGQIRADYRKIRQIEEDYLYGPARVSAAM